MHLGINLDSPLRMCSSTPMHCVNTDCITPCFTDIVLVHFAHPSLARALPYPDPALMHLVQCTPCRRATALITQAVARPHSPDTRYSLRMVRPTYLLSSLLMFSPFTQEASHRSHIPEHCPPSSVMPSSTNSTFARPHLPDNVAAHFGPSNASSRFALVAGCTTHAILVETRIRTSCNTSAARKTSTCLA